MTPIFQFCTKCRSTANNHVASVNGGRQAATSLLIGDLLPKIAGSVDRQQQWLQALLER
jgi:hypothetical protein